MSLNKGAVALLRNWFLRRCTRDGIDPQAIDFDAVVSMEDDWRTNENGLLEQLRHAGIGTQLRLDRPIARSELLGLRSQADAYNAELREEEETMLRELGLAYSGERVWWFQVPSSEISFVERFLTAKGIRFIQRHETYRYRVKSESGTLHRRTQERVPTMFGIAIRRELVQPLLDELGEHGFRPMLYHGSTVPQFKGYLPPASNSSARMWELQESLAEVRRNYVGK
jgi:hypothetical protein